MHVCLQLLTTKNAFCLAASEISDLIFSKMAMTSKTQHVLSSNSRDGWNVSTNLLFGLVFISQDVPSLKEVFPLHSLSFSSTGKRKLSENILKETVILIFKLLIASSCEAFCNYSRFVPSILGTLSYIQSSLHHWTQI